MRLELERRTLSFSENAHASYGALGEREILQVELQSRQGHVGYGEAAPLEPYDGVSIARVERALREYARALDGVDGGAQGLEACRATDPLPQALAAIDIALWDMAGRARRTARLRAALRSARAGGSRQRDDHRGRSQRRGERGHEGCRSGF